MKTLQAHKEVMLSRLRIKGVKFYKGAMSTWNQQTTKW